MKKVLLVLLLSVLSVVLIGCGKSNKVETYKTVKEMVKAANLQIKSISAKDFKNLELASEDYLFDLRTSGEFAKGAISDAIHLQRGLLEFRLASNKKWALVNTKKPLPSKNSKIYLYCAKGSRAALSALSLKKIGFTNVTVLKGGYVAYKKLQNK